MLDLHQKRHTPCQALSSQKKYIYNEKIERYYVNMGKVIWKTEKIIWIIKAKNANEVKEFFTI